MIPWIGGKQALCRAIISRFPADFRQRSYVEVFGGGASVLLNKERSVKEIYNDFNSNLVNLFRVVRDSPSELQAALRYLLNAREDFDTVKARLARGHNKDPVLWARDFYQLIRQSYGGGGTSFGASPRSTWAAFPLIDAVAERFQYVVVEHMSYERLLRTHDSEGTIFYLDPPYVLTEDYYGNLFGPKDHLLLAETLFGAKALWLLSYNDCDTIRALYSVPGIYIEKIERINNLAQRYDPGNMYQELLISNYDSHQGIISKQEFLKAQNLMKKRYQNVGNRSPHLFTGRIQCPDCKHHFRYSFSSGKEYWVCPDRTNGISSCTAIHISEMSLILAVLNFEAKLLLNFDAYFTIVMNLLREIEHKQGGTDTKLFELDQSIAALNDKSLTLQKLSSKGFISPDEFRIQNESLATQRKKLSTERNKKLHGLQSYSAMEKLEELQAVLSSWPGVPTEFDIDQFDEIVEKIIPTADNKLTFRLHCGLELTEEIPS